MNQSNAEAHTLMKSHLIESLLGKNAHIPLDEVLKNFPPELINRKMDGIPYSSWDLLEHMRIAQHDIIDFIVNEDYRELNWPNDYWPKEEGDIDMWNNSISSFQSDRDALAEMVRKEDIELFGPLPYAPGYTLFREITLMANHNSYHTGQLVLLRRALHSWQ